MGSFDRIWTTYMEGVVAFYALDEQKTAIRYCANFTLDAFAPDEGRLRSNRLRLKKSDREQLPENTLHDEIVVVIGPDASPRKVLRRLERLVRQIRKEGLYVGTTDLGFLFEDVETGKIKEDTSM